MARFIFYAFLILFIVLIVIGIRFATSSYKLLPMPVPPVADTSMMLEWNEFSPESQNFTVLLPVLPQHASQSMSDPKSLEKRQYEMYVSQKNDGTIFMISSIHFMEAPPDVPNENTMKTLVNDMVESNPENQLLEYNNGFYESLPSVEFKISNPEMNMLGKTFIQGKTLYVLTMIANQKEADLQEFKFFTNSFKLLK